MYQFSVPSDITPLYVSKLKHYILWSKEPIKEQCFLDFLALESKFVKFLMSVLKRQVNPSSNFTLFFIVMIHNSSANFKVIPFLLWTKGPHQSPCFDTFKCSGENLTNFSSLFSKPQVSFSSKFAYLFSDMKGNSSVLL